MRRYGKLKDKILSQQNIIDAEHNARKCKNNTYGVKRFDRRDDLTLDAIRDSMMNGTYKTSEYRIFKIYEPKERVIYQLPYYPDRIVHHMLMNILEPIFVKWFIKNTYSCIKGRGIHCLQNDVEKDLRKFQKETTWCLKLDIKKFYPSIDNNILYDILCRKIKDKWVLNILREIINSTDKGVPIGNYLSQFFANIYLNILDHFVKERLHIRFYYRYCDDIVIFGNDKKYLYKIYRIIGQQLSFIKLRLKKPKLFPAEFGVDFGGYVFRHLYTKIRKTIKVRFKRIAKRYNNTSKKKYKDSLSSYYGWLIHCDGIHLLKLNIESLYYEFKKHYFKNCGVRTCVVGKRRKTSTI